MTDRLRRTMLFVPGGNEKIFNKALGLEVDGLILDLEDSVALERKDSAREAVSEIVKGVDFGTKEKVVRINALSTDFGREDIKKIIPGRPDTLLIPKVERAEDVIECDRLISEVEKEAELPVGQIGLIALIESPIALYHIENIALAAPRMNGLLFGAADFTRETGGKITGDRQELFYPLMRILLAARIAGIDALDTPYFDLNDPEGLKRHAEQAKNMGYDGKALIHPSQVEMVNGIFTPTLEEIQWARKVIAAFQSAREAGKGVVQLDGKVIENVHVAGAEKMLKIAARVGLD